MSVIEMSQYWLDLIRLRLCTDLSLDRLSECFGGPTHPNLMESLSQVTALLSQNYPYVVNNDWEWEPASFDILGLQNIELCILQINVFVSVC